MGVILEQVNKMKRLPNAIGDLTNLSMLGLARNQLEYLPDTLKMLTNLKYIDVHVNHLHTLLSEDDWHAYEKHHEDREVLAVYVDTHSPGTPATPATPASRPGTQGSGASVPATPTTPQRRLRRHKTLHAADVDEKFQVMLAPIHTIIPPDGIILLAGLRDFECSYNELDALPDLARMVRAFQCPRFPTCLTVNRTTAHIMICATRKTTMLTRFDTNLRTSGESHAH
jgi:hypothetical protein